MKVQVDTEYKPCKLIFLSGHGMTWIFDSHRIVPKYVIKISFIRICHSSFEISIIQYCLNSSCLNK